MGSLIRKSIKSIFNDSRDSIFKNIGIKRKFGGGQNKNAAHNIMYEIIAAKSNAQTEATIHTFNVVGHCQRHENIFHICDILTD